jgi:hypothetical protein
MDSVSKKIIFNNLQSDKEFKSKIDSSIREGWQVVDTYSIGLVSIGLDLSKSNDYTGIHFIQAN